MKLWKSFLNYESDMMRSCGACVKPRKARDPVNIQLSCDDEKRRSLLQEKTGALYLSKIWKRRTSVPCESFLSRAVSRIRYLGVRAIPGLVVYRMLSLLFHYRAVRCVWVDLEYLHKVSDETFGVKVRSLNAGEIKSQAKQIGEDPDDVNRAFAAGVEAFGALNGESITSSLWISPHPPSLNDEFTLEFEGRLAYLYKAFTLPEFRGLGLMPCVLRAAIENCASRGYRGAVACIDIANRPSWKAFRSAGFKTIATFRFAEVFGRRWIQPTGSQSKPRFRVRRILPKKRPATHLTD
jgi:ribosomal protein S18 acetylase RimI-like enzyme